MKSKYLDLVKFIESFHALMSRDNNYEILQKIINCYDSKNASFDDIRSIIKDHLTKAKDFNYKDQT